MKFIKWLRSSEGDWFVAGFLTGFTIGALVFVWLATGVRI